MYTTKSSTNDVAGENHHNVWQQYRPTSTINFSDIVEDQTIYDRTRSEATFDTNEITGRSSAWTNEQAIDTDALSVADILDYDLKHDLSQAHRGSMSTSMSNHFQHTSQFQFGNEFSCESVEFRPAEEVSKFLF